MKIFDKKIIIAAPTYSENTGIGRHTITLKNIYFHNNKKKVSILSFSNFKLLQYLYELLSKIRLSFLMDFIFIIYIFLYKLFSNNYLISSSCVCPPNIDEVHFSSCHLNSFIELKSKHKILFPHNLFYIFLEIINFSLCKKKIFLSEIEKERFLSLYSFIPHFKKFNVFKPILSPDLVSKKSQLKKNNNLNKFLTIGYQFKVKGIDLLLDLFKNFNDYNLTIIGLKKFSTGYDNIHYLGKMKYQDIDWQSYRFFIFPSNTDSYGFVVQEAVINGLIPIVSSMAGVSEHFNNHPKFKILVVDHNNKISKKDLIRRYKDKIDFVTKYNFTRDDLKQMKKLFSFKHYSNLVLKNTYDY